MQSKHDRCRLTAAAGRPASIRSEAENCHRRNSLPLSNNKMVQGPRCQAEAKIKRQLSVESCRFILWSNGEARRTPRVHLAPFWITRVNDKANYFKVNSFSCVENDTKYFIIASPRKRGEHVRPSGANLPCANIKFRRNDNEALQ